MSSDIQWGVWTLREGRLYQDVPTPKEFLPIAGHITKVEESRKASGLEVALFQSIDRLRSELEEYRKTDSERLENQKADGRLKILRRLEWLPDAYDDHLFCVLCKSSKECGHADDCALGNLLKEAT